MPASAQSSFKLNKLGPYFHNSMGLVFFIMGTLFFSTVLLLGSLSINALRNQKFNPNSSQKQNAPLRASQSDIFANFKTDLSKKSIDLNNIVAGGPGKDGIMALVNPSFVKLENVQFVNSIGEVPGVVVSVDNVYKFYPYNILVWHEAINDDINGFKYVVSYSPLTGTYRVFNRSRWLDSSVNFKVSGLLHEVNDLLYDDQTESLWQQSTGKAVAGKYNGEILDAVHFQLVTLGEFDEMANKKKSETITDGLGAREYLVMSSDTGYNRNYNEDPYAQYNKSEYIYPEHKLTYRDDTMPVKNTVLAFDAPDGESHYAIPVEKLEEGVNAFSVDEGMALEVVKTGNFYEFNVLSIEDGVPVRSAVSGGFPFYFEMWFSWAVQHRGDGKLLVNL